jgi:DNA mismatch endonuclease, patch repair protein
LRMPKSNQEYWIAKIERNKSRDTEVNTEYKKMGWLILRFWEHQLKEDFENCIKKVVEVKEQ